MTSASTSSANPPLACRYGSSTKTGARHLHMAGLPVAPRRRPRRPLKLKRKRQDISASTRGRKGRRVTVRKGVLVLIMSGLAVAGSAGVAQAGPITTICPGTPQTTDREFSITISDINGQATCAGSGVGNLSGNGDPINALNGGSYWQTLDKTDDPNPGGVYDPPSFLTFTGAGLLGGHFSFNPFL